MADTLQGYRLVIEARAPLAFPATKRGTQFQSSLDYVPGATLYGALGAALSNQGSFTLELIEQIRCHNAYPLPAAEKPPGDDSDITVSPLPITALRAKGSPNAPVVDALIRRVCWEQQQPAALIYAPVDHDGRPLEVATGFWASDAHAQWARNAKGKREQPAVTQRMLTRVGINRRRATAEDSILYSSQVISEATRLGGSYVPTRFVGSLLVPAASTTLVKNALSDVDRLGGRQTTGLGAVCIKETGQTPEDTEDVKKRVEKMTWRFQKQAQRYEQLGGEPWDLGGAQIFTVNLLSDALLLKQGWQPTQQLSEDMLKESTGVDATLLRAFASNHMVGGWNVSWQRPKPTALATTMGSVFVFQSRAPLTDENYARLAQLQLDGLGERRAEGYGQVRICDAFHLRDTSAQSN